MKLTYMLAISFFGLSFACANDHEMPEELSNLGYSTIYIPEELGLKYDTFTTLEEKIEYLRTHPLLSYDVSDKHFDEMKSRFEKAKVLEKQQQSWIAWIGFKTVENPLKIYLDLAEGGYAPANYRLSKAFKRGELGLRVNSYWAKVFADRPCDSLSMDNSIESFKAALCRFEKEQRGEIKERDPSDEDDYSGDEASQEYRKDSSESLSDDTTSTLRVSDETGADEDTTYVKVYDEQSQQKNYDTTQLRRRNIKKGKEEKDA